MRIKETDVDAPVLGFCEMMTIKLGEMMDFLRVTLAVM